MTMNEMEKCCGNFVERHRPPRKSFCGRASYTMICNWNRWARTSQGWRCTRQGNYAFSESCVHIYIYISSASVASLAPPQGGASLCPFLNFWRPKCVLVKIVLQEATTSSPHIKLAAGQCSAVMAILLWEAGENKLTVACKWDWKLWRVLNRPHSTKICAVTAIKAPSYGPRCGQLTGTVNQKQRSVNR